MKGENLEKSLTDCKFNFLIALFFLVIFLVHRGFALPLALISLLAVPLKKGYPKLSAAMSRFARRTLTNTLSFFMYSVLLCFGISLLVFIISTFYKLTSI